MRAFGPWRAAAAPVALVMTLVGLGVPATARPEPPPITVTHLVGPDDQPMVTADHVNDDGLVTGTVASPPVGPGLGGRAVVRHGDVASYLGIVGVTVYDVSERGQVVGQQAAALAAAGFSWKDGVWTPLVDPPPGSDPNEPRPWVFSAPGVAERGRVIGLRADPTAEPAWAETAVWRDGEVVASTGGARDSEGVALPTDINNRGQVVVNVPGRDGEARVAGVWRIDGGEIRELGTLGGAESWGAAIDRWGRVAGVSETAEGEQHAFLWQRGRMIDLGTLGGATSTIGDRPSDPPSLADDVDDALNDRGQVVGTSETGSGDEHAFLWQRGRMIDLGTLGGATSRATALNNRGQVVGYSETAEGERHAFLWQDGEMTDLGALVGAGDSEATDINDRGQVVGRAGGQAVMWTVPPSGR